MLMRSKTLFMLGLSWSYSATVGEGSFNSRRLEKHLNSFTHFLSLTNTARQALSAPLPATPPLHRHLHSVTHPGLYFTFFSRKRMFLKLHPRWWNSAKSDRLVVLQIEKCWATAMERLPDVCKTAVPARKPNLVLVPCAGCVIFPLNVFPLSAKCQKWPPCSCQSQTQVLAATDVLSDSSQSSQNNAQNEQAGPILLLYTAHGPFRPLQLLLPPS